MPEFGDYTAATTLGDTDLMVILQSATTKKITGANMKTSIFASPTIVTPTIASFINATHDHEDAAGGGMIAMAAVTGLSAAISAKQDGDADLTAIAALTPSNDDVLQRKAGGWTNRTIAQLKTDLSLSGTNTGDQDLSGYALLGHNHTGTYQPLDADLTAIAALADPNADRLLFWDDSVGAYAYLTLGTNLSITDTTINAAGGGGSPGGSDTQLQRNDGGAFGGISGATSDGTNVTFGSGNLRATSPRFTTGILDANGNPLLAFTATGSAVDGLTVTNSAAGNPGMVTVAATGSDSNVSLQLSAKGNGVVQIGGNFSGGMVGSMRMADTGTNPRIFLAAYDAAQSFISLYGSGGNPMIKFTATANAENGIDLGIGRNAADIAEINNGTAGQYRDLRVRKILDTNGAQVVTTRQAFIADPTGGATTDAEARTSIVAILDLLIAHGLMAAA